MNSRERVRAALTGQAPDRIPKALAFWEESVPGIPNTAEALGLDVRFVRFEPPPAQDDFLSYLRRLPADVHVGNLGQLRIYHEWDYHPERGPEGPLSAARTLEELAGHILPDLADPRRYAGLAKQVAAYHARGWAVAGGPPHLGGELFETAYRLRGFHTFLEDLRLRPALARYLLDQLTSLVIHNTLILARAGIDILLLDDDVAMPTGMIIGPAMWRAFFKPRLADAIRLAREASPDLLVFYHSDGDFTAIVPDLIEIGVNVINPVQPDCMDALALKQAFGDRLALWGTVGTAALWDHGTPDDVHAEVRLRAATLGPAGLLLCPAYDIDFTPRENILAFAEAVNATTELYTIGYGARTLDAFISVLQAQRIAYVADVRSAPYSKFKPEFSRPALEAALKRHGIGYLYLGDALGGQPKDAECYADGKVLYDRIKEKAFFKDGIARLRRAFEQGRRVALMCSEGKPELCHRSVLIGAALTELGVPVTHIDENDALADQETVIARRTGGQLSLLDDPEFRSRKRYPKP